MDSIQAIETQYKGYRFRSRLEARWAVFFDALGIKWEYEPEGFEIPFDDGNIRYLPDFKLVEHDIWVEVKGSEEQFKQDAERIAWMVDFGHLPGVSVSDPKIGATGGLLILGPVPDQIKGFRSVHPVLYHEKGVRIAMLSFVALPETPIIPFWDIFGDSPVSSAPDLPDLVGNFGWMGFTGYTTSGYVPATYSCPIHHFPKANDSAKHAYKAARSARFEHGECGI